MSGSSRVPISNAYVPVTFTVFAKRKLRLLTCTAGAVATSFKCLTNIEEGFVSNLRQLSPCCTLSNELPGNTSGSVRLL